MLEDLLDDIEIWKPKSLHLNVPSFSFLSFVRYGDCKKKFHKNEMKKVEELNNLCISDDR